MHKISKCIETVISNWCATIKYAANVYALAPEFSFLIALESQKNQCVNIKHTDYASMKNQFLSETTAPF